MNSSEFDPKAIEYLITELQSWLEEGKTVDGEASITSESGNAEVSDPVAQFVERRMTGRTHIRIEMDVYVTDDAQYAEYVAARARGELGAEVMGFA